MDVQKKNDLLDGAVRENTLHYNADGLINAQIEDELSKYMVWKQCKKGR